MAYIPEKHLKYNLLPLCQKKGYEVFSYPCRLVDELSSLLPNGSILIPYGFSSYEKYYERVNESIELYCEENEYLKSKLLELIDLVKKMNVKEDWAVMYYVGETTADEFLGLTKGRCYYWPCSVLHPKYEGVIDNKEFTSYLSYPTKKKYWEVLEDPLGITKFMK